MHRLQNGGFSTTSTPRAASRPHSARLCTSERGRVWLLQVGFIQQVVLIHQVQVIIQRIGAGEGPHGGSLRRGRRHAQLQGEAELQWRRRAHLEEKTQTGANTR